MMGEPAGWYRDPAPANRSAPTTLRFWDGKQWTTQTKPAPKRERQAWQAELAAQQQAWAMQQAQHRQATGATATGVAYAGAPAYAPVDREATPDGQRLAHWWPRVGATVVDWLITTTLGTVAGWHFIGEIVQGLSTLALQPGQPGVTPDLGPLVGPFVALAAVMWGVKMVYHCGFLKAFAATPGKLLVGLEVRLRERPGPLSWGTVLKRLLAQNIGNLVSAVPLVGGLVGLVYVLLDVLWPLWDGKRQALHDKLAATNVVTRR